MNLESMLKLPFHWYFLWAFLIPVFLTIIPPKPYRAYISCTILFAILIKATFFYHIDPLKSNVSIALILQGVLFNLFFYTFNLFFLVEYPEFTDFRPGIETLDEVKSLKPCTWKKFKWCIKRSILMTVTGYGWNWQILSSSINSKHRKFNDKFEWLKHFLVNNLLIKYTIYDIFFHLYISTDYIKTNGWGTGHTKDLILFSKDSKLTPIMQLILAFGSVYCIYFGIETLYNISLFINLFVLQINDINDYPVIFGSFEGDYTIKSLWGNLWHKLMYQLAVPQSKFLVGCDYKAKHLNKSARFGNEKWRKYLFFLTVFIFTGIFHATGTLNMPWLNGKGYNINVPFDASKFPKFISRCFYSFSFFPAQFFLILIESVVKSFYKSYIAIELPDKLSMIIGLTWIGVSEIYLLQLYVDELVKSGFNITELVSTHTPVHYLFKHFSIKM